jgi:LDH2 family malate/lactate/ureidoglycolate dehydrogenase
MSAKSTEIGISRDEMIDVARDVLMRVSTPEDNALSVAQSLVSAQEAGHASHGVIRLIEYTSFVKKGTVIPGAQPKLLREVGAIGIIDGNWGWGQVACKFALAKVKEQISNFGTYTITVKNVNHIGRLGEYMETLTKEGLFSMMWCNSDPAVAAYGGVTRMFGTNPFAAGIPNGKEPIIIDFATAASAEGKLRVARANGQSVPTGMVIDKDGQDSTDPKAFYDGGSILPFGGHKGYCMSLFVELVGGALSGGHAAMAKSYIRGNGTVLIAMDPEFFVGSEIFEAEIAESAAKIKSTRPAKPENPVLLPGEVENQCRARNKEQVHISEPIWQSILELQNSL